MHKLIPHLFLTFFLGVLANNQVRFLKNLFIRIFISIYKPNMDEAIHSDIDKYTSYNDFFTRRLKEGSRKIDSSLDVFISPVDGEIVDHGQIKEGQLIQAKDYKYSLNDLTGKDYEDNFDEGYFITIYLAPTDYHRIHCPFGGKITASRHLGESLFSVNKAAQDSIPNLYIKNERSVLEMDCEKLQYSLVSVGASVVGSIVPYWSDGERVSRKKLIEDWNKGPNEKTKVQKGDELAHFRMGSTVILIFENLENIDLDSLNENMRVKFGDKLLSLKNI